MKQQCLFLMGFMASGKSSLGKKLALQLNMPFIETDALIERKAGCSISSIFSQKGENYFRELESQVLREIDFNENQVISLGGGTACSDENLSFIQSKGTTIYFQVPIPVLIGRLRQKRDKRPLTSNLNDDEIASMVKEKMALRIPYYEKAKLIFDAQDRDLKKLLEALQRHSLL